MLKNSKPWHIMFATLGVAALALTGCSSAESADSETGAAEEQSLTIAAQVPDSLNQHQMSSDAAWFSPLQHVMQPLVTRNPEDPTEVIPSIAESWEMTSDTTWEFTLFEDATFSDGSPVTSADVAASIQNVVDLGSALAPQLTGITDMDSSDDKTLIIETEEPNPTLLRNLSMLLIGQGDRLDDEAYWEAPIGSGQFVVEDYSVDDQLLLVDNENYWGEDDSALDEIVFKSYPETSSQITALANGEVDIVASINPDQVPEVEAMDGVTYEQIPSWGYSFMWFNSSVEPFDDPNVRRAMWHAVDVEKVVDDVLGDFATVAQAPIPQTVFGAPQLEQYEYDPELAREMLAEAGYPDGFEVALQWKDSPGGIDEMLSEAFISYWADAGVTVLPEPKESAVYSEDFGSMNWEMTMQGNNVATGDADYTLGRLYLCEAERNGYCNPELDEILLDARSELDQDRREELYAEASTIIWEDAVGIFPRDATRGYAYGDNVSNLIMDPAARHSYLSVVLNEQ